MAWLLTLAVAVCVAVWCLGGAAGAAAPPTAWSWAETSSFWDGSGVPFAATVWADPTGVRKGSVLEVEFDRCGYSLYVSNGAGRFHFQNGKDYTLLFDVMETPECGHAGELDVRVTASVPGVTVQKAMGHVSASPDGEWHTVPVHIEDFSGADGDYYLHLYDQCGAGCWMIGDIRQTGGSGHK